jgi:hypothetical protein
MYNTEENKRTIKGRKFNPESILWAQAWEFHCRQKRSAVCVRKENGLITREINK